MNHRQLKKIWICTDVLMDILPYFERVELGLTLALLSPRFDVLVDAHFDGKSELTIWRLIRIYKDITRPKATLSVRIDDDYVDFPWPDYPLPNKIRFLFLRIEYIDHSVIKFLRSNKQIWDNGTNLYLHFHTPETGSNVRPIWDVFVRQIWPIFTTTNVHHLRFGNADHLNTLLRFTSPTILTDLKQLHSIDSFGVFPEAIVNSNGPKATPTAGHALSKWLHISTTDGRPKKLRCTASLDRPPPNLKWINSFKEAFLRATSSVSYQVNFGLNSSTPIDLFELENERTKEKLTMDEVLRYPSNWLMKRCPINGKTAAIQQQKDKNSKLNNVYFMLSFNNCIGPLTAEEEKADESNEKMFSTTPGPSGSAAE